MLMPALTVVWLLKFYIRSVVKLPKPFRTVVIDANTRVTNERAETG